jgi:hypothetical protein
MFCAKGLPGTMRFVLTALLMSTLAASAAAQKDGHNSTRIQTTQTGFLNAERNSGEISVTWDDIHGWHGGFSLAITGMEKVAQKATRRVLGEPQNVPAPELNEGSLRDTAQTRSLETVRKISAGSTSATR